MAKEHTADPDVAPDDRTHLEDEEKKDVRDLSIGKIVAYVIGGFTILAGVANFVDGLFGTGLVLLIAGAFGFPPVRAMIEDELRVKLSRWLATLIYLVLITIAGGLAA